MPTNPPAPAHQRSRHWPAVPRFGRRIAVALALVLAAWAGVPGRLAEWLHLDWKLLELDALWQSPTPFAFGLAVAVLAMLFGAGAAALLLESAEPDTAAFLPWRRRSEPATQVMGVPVTLPTRVATPAPGSHAVRLIYLPTLVAGAARDSRPSGRGLPVLAPAAGLVMRVVDRHPDASSEPRNPPRNHVLIRLESGLYLRLANLAQNSAAVLPGQHVAAGALIGGCGYATDAVTPQATAEVLVQVQATEDDGATALPFRFASFIEMGQSGPRWIDEAAPRPGAIIRGVRPIGAPGAYAFGG